MRARTRWDSTVWRGCLARAARQSTVAGRVEELLRYLEMYPTGVHNRAAAEHVEDLLEAMGPAHGRSQLHARFRALRDAVMPPIEPDTWAL